MKSATRSGAVRDVTRRKAAALAGIALALGTAMTGATTAQAAPESARAAKATPFYDSLVNYHSGKCLEIPGGSTKNGVQAQQWTCNGRKHQKWMLRYSETRVGLKLYYAVNERSGKCLSVKGGSSKNGTQIIQWPCRVGDIAELFAPLKVNDVPGTNFVLWNAKTGKYPQVDGASQANGAKVSQWKGQSGKHHFYWRFN
ncbi:RICIN domain-containing protein [Streptomyces sp. SCL15-4]|uniref:RICIN domain-containing protein n=1 Tax=Streptomyces sp. SCL15-4 TaxID=2967221 RepID=UPI0029667BF8|nr:RICIN domain-containing protein [Streptomyces sp. SCL15-4]